MESHPCWSLLAKQKASFTQWSDTGCIKHTPGQDNYPGVDRHKINFKFFCFMLFYGLFALFCFVWTFFCLIGVLILWFEFYFCVLMIFSLNLFHHYISIMVSPHTILLVLPQIPIHLTPFLLYLSFTSKNKPKANKPDENKKSNKIKTQHAHTYTHIHTFKNTKLETVVYKKT